MLSGGFEMHVRHHTDYKQQDEQEANPYAIVIDDYVRRRSLAMSVLDQFLVQGDKHEAEQEHRLWLEYHEDSFVDTGR